MDRCSAVMADRQTVELPARGQAHAMAPDLAEAVEHLLGRHVECGPMQPVTQCPLDDQRQEADEGVSTDPVGQTMVDRADVELVLHDPEAPLDVGKKKKGSIPGLLRGMRRNLSEGLDKLGSSV